MRECVEIDYKPIVLTYSEIKWIERQVENFDYLQEDEWSSDWEWKEAFDEFYEGLRELHQKYQTKNLSKMLAFGIGYDGIIPGNNVSFEKLYEKLIYMIRDKIIDKPIRYYGEVDGEYQLIEEYESGIKRYLNGVKV